VVVTGAGGGREVLALREQGFDAVGYEPNERFAAAGERLLAERGHAGTFHHSGRSVFPEDLGQCDAVIIGWGSYMHMAPRARRVAFLAGARRVLPEGAPLLVSFFEREARTAYFDQVARVANVLRRMRRADPVELGDALIPHPHFLHHFTREEIEAELRDGGFEPVAFERHPYAHAVGRASV
jgi:hypothetical protein